MANNVDARVLSLEKHCVMFERSADCNQILGMLRMHGMISTLDMQRLQAETTQMDRNRFVKLCGFNACQHHWLTYISM